MTAFGRLHKTTLGTWKSENERNGSAIGAAITRFLFEELEPNALDDSHDMIPRVPMPAPRFQKLPAARDDQQRTDDAE